jgi:signal transduction histidine kinase
VTRLPETPEMPLRGDDVLGGTGAASFLLAHHQHLGSRIWVQVGIRAFVSAAIIVGAWLGAGPVGVDQLPVARLVVVGLVLGGYNMLILLLVHPYRDPARATEAQRFLHGVLYTTIVIDYSILTYAVWLVGGALSPFLAFFPLHLMNCILLSRRAAVGSTIWAFTLLSGLVLGEYFGLIPAPAPAGMVPVAGALDGRYILMVLVVFALLFAAIVFLLRGFSELLRGNELHIREVNEELERLSSMRRDFLHITLHNIQAPVGAATMLLNNLRAGFGGPLTPDQDRWLERSLQRLDDVSDFMHDLRVLGSLESETLREEVREVDLRTMLQGLEEEYAEMARARRHRLTLELPTVLPPVRGIERLLREAVANFITNAIKYTAEGGRIVIRARGLPTQVRIEVQDNGIGIAPEDQERLFDEFVRIRRAGTPLANVPGDGLGLSIVRHVVQAHGGRTGVESELDRGSTFYVLLPTASTSASPSAPAAGSPD